MHTNTSPFRRAGMCALAIVVLLLTTVATGPAASAQQAGSASCAGITASVDRLYSAFFLRPPDPSGRAYWTDRYLAGQVSLPGAATNFANSPEFQARYGQLSDEQFVRLIYRNVLQRDADAGGLSFWTGRLRNGASRGLVMTGFSESPEYVSKTGTAAPLSRTPFPLGTRFYCGSGNQVIPIAPPAGGAIVRASMGGTSNNIIWTRGANLERGDLLVNEIGTYQGDQLMGLGWSSRADARNLEIQSGGGWAIAVAPLSFARPMGNEASGRGDSVLWVDRGPGVVTYNHNGRRNFIVWSYSGTRSHLFANEIGPVQGQKVLDGVPGYLQIDADGDWTLRFG